MLSLFLACITYASSCLSLCLLHWRILQLCWFQFEQNSNIIWIFFFFSSNQFKHFSNFLNIHNVFFLSTGTFKLWIAQLEIDNRGIFSFLDFEKSWTYSHPNTTFARYSPRSQFRTAKMTLTHESKLWTFQKPKVWKS